MGIWVRTMHGAWIYAKGFCIECQKGTCAITAWHKDDEETYVIVVGFPDKESAQKCLDNMVTSALIAQDATYIMGVSEEDKTGGVYDKKFILQILGTLALDEHMGDVRGTIRTVLDKIGIDGREWSTPEELIKVLGKLGVTTLHGTSLREGAR